MRLYAHFLLMVLLSGCGNEQQISGSQFSGETQHESVMQSLDVSTQIVMQLLKQDALSKVLEESDPASLARLVKNFSPSEMALEAEVLNW